MRGPVCPRALWQPDNAARRNVCGRRISCWRSIRLRSRLALEKSYKRHYSGSERNLHPPGLYVQNQIQEEGWRWECPTVPRDSCNAETRWGMMQFLYRLRTCQKKGWLPTTGMGHHHPTPPWNGAVPICVRVERRRSWGARCIIGAVRKAHPKFSCLSVSAGRTGLLWRRGAPQKT